MLDALNIDGAQDLARRTPSLSITAFVKNIADNREIISRDRPSTVTQNAVAGLAAPQIYGVRVNYKCRAGVVGIR